MKRAYFWIAVLLLLFISIGNKDHIQVSERAMIHAVGIDSSDEGVTVTLQVFQAEGSGGDTQIDPSKPNVMVISATAESFDEAMSECQNQLGNHIFIGHNQIIVFGSGVTFENPKELLGYFISSKDNYMGVNVVIAENTASELLSVPLTTSTTASENFAAVIEMYQENGEAPATDMLHFLNALESRDKSTAVPIVSVRSRSSEGDSSESESSQSGGQDGESDEISQPLVKIERTAIIKNGRIAAYLDADECQGLSVMTKKARRVVVNIDIEDKAKMGISLKKYRSKLTLERSGDRLVCHALISAKMTADENSAGDLSEKEVISRSEKALKDNCEKMIERSYRQCSADILDVERLIRFYYPQIYLNYYDRFDELLSQMDFDIQVSLRK